jgi:hypothetical protein
MLQMFRHDEKFMISFQGQERAMSNPYLIHRKSNRQTIQDIKSPAIKFHIQGIKLNAFDVVVLNENVEKKKLDQKLIEPRI